MTRNLLLIGPLALLLVVGAAGCLEVRVGDRHERIRQDRDRWDDQDNDHHGPEFNPNGDGRFESGPPPVQRDNGCWVTIFSRNDFDRSREWAVVQGPGQWPELKDLRRADGDGWGDDMDSIIVGPRARVVLFRDKNFKGRAVEFGPGTRIPNLGKTRLGGNAADAMILYFVR